MNNPIPAQRIGADLVKALGLPKMTTSFTLRVVAGECVTVSCEYYPEDGGIVSALAVYDLVERTTPLPPAPKPSQQHFDDWMRELTDHAHREYMERIRSLPPCDTSIQGVARYMGAPI